jgi:hypothetical protein
MIDIDVEFRDGFAPRLRVGVNECVADPTLVLMTGTQKYATKPIEIVAQGTSTVTFSVIQSWVDHPACYVATDYSSTNGQKCERADNVAPGEIDTYTATCSNSVAQVTIYVHSSDFDIDADNADVPERCDPVGQGQTVAYTFDIPCTVEGGSDVCAPTPQLKCDHFDSQIISSEDFENPEHAKSWLFAEIGTLSNLGLGLDSPEISKTFEVPTDSALIVLEFDFYDNDNLAISDEVYVRINDVYLEIFSYTSGTREGTKTGTFGEIAASITASGNTHHIELTIPDDWYSDGRLQIGFKIATNSASEFISFDNIMLSSVCDLTASAAAQTDEITCEMGHAEDFENSEALSWVNGIEASDSALTTFLGRLGRENPDISKTFEVPSIADTITIVFDFYSIDGHGDGEKVFVGVQGTYLDLNLFSSSKGTTSVHFNDIKVTIMERKTYDIGFSSEMDKKFNVQIEIPKEWYANGELEIGFRVQMTKSVVANGGGIDNFAIEASCPTPAGRRAEEGKTPPGLEPSSDAEDDSFYCTSDDFPCEDGSKTHVCHYSAKRGYQTFCIPEADSEILRFYSNDYCGPCVGGYGGAETA